MSSTNELDALLAAALEAGDDPRITTYALGEMEPADRAAFEAELLARPELKQEVDRVRKLSRLIQGELQAEAAPVAGLPVEVKARVVGGAPVPAGKAGAVIRWRTYLPHMAAAGLLGMVGLSAVTSFKGALDNAYDGATGKVSSDIAAKINGSDDPELVNHSPTWPSPQFAPPRATEAAPVVGSTTGVAGSPDPDLVRLEAAEGQAARLAMGALDHDKDRLDAVVRELDAATRLYRAAPSTERPPSTTPTPTGTPDGTRSFRAAAGSALPAPGGDKQTEAKEAREGLSYALTEGELDPATKNEVRRVAEEAGRLEQLGDLVGAVALYDRALEMAGGDPRAGDDARTLDGRTPPKVESGRPGHDAEAREVAGLLTDLEATVALGPQDPLVRAMVAQAKEHSQRGELGEARARIRATVQRLNELRAAASSSDNPFKKAAEENTGTFSIDVDTAGFATVRNSIERGQLPAPSAVRIEELLNYFPYSYAPPTGGVPFASNVEVTACPWQPKNRLVRIGLKGREIARDARPVSNLVFLIDVSGSMQEPQKLPLLKQSLIALVDNLSEKDRVAIVVYAGASGLVLPSTTGDRKREIIAALDQLQAGGGTNGGAGIELAYKVASECYIQGGTNRVVLCTDGDWNVGISSTDGVERLVVEKAKSGVFLTCLGFFGSNYQDQLMERMADKGNGNYAAIDSLREAKKVLVEEMSGTLVTIAKDVKVQVEFDKEKVEAYRLIGYENRVLANRDFSDDTKDAGEIGAGHCVTALYEVEPKAVAAGGDLLTLRLRWKKPDGETSELLETKVPDSDKSLGQASVDTRFAASVAAWGMLLRGSPHKGSASFGLVLELGGDALGKDPGGHRAAWLELVKKSKALAGK